MAFEFKFPDVGEGVHEGTLVKWLAKEGDAIKEDQPIAEIETDKAVVEIPSPKPGIVLKLQFKEGDTIHVGDIIMVIGEAGEAISPKVTPTKTAAPSSSRAAVQTSASASPAPPVSAQQMPGMVLATPHTRQLARDLGVDITTIVGSGPAGRITDDDVKAMTITVVKRASLPSAAMAPGQPARPTAPSRPKFAFERYGRVIRVPFTGIKKTIADHLVETASHVVPVTHMDEADVTKLAVVREKMKPMAQKKGIKLTYLSFVIKASIAALKAHRDVNVSLDEEKQEIALKHYYHIGIAVDTPDGLLVPVLKDADQHSIMDLASQLQDMAERARDRELGVEDFRGSTFSITNLGSIGGLHFTPIINYPDAAILGIGRIQERVVQADGRFETRKILPLSLTFDHRLIDGALAANFMNTIIRHLEDPDLLLVDA